MEIAYSGDAFHTYMVIQGEEFTDNEEEEKMMSNQSARVLLSFQMQQLNEQKSYCYDISGGVEFKSFIEKKQADRGIVQSVIRFIIGLNQAVDEYLLDPDGLLLHPECMYLEMPEEKLRAAYVPGRKEDFSTQLKMLTAWLLENTFHGDKEGVLLVYEFYKRVQQENFLPKQLQDLLVEERPEESEVPEEFLDTEEQEAELQDAEKERTIEEKNPKTGKKPATLILAAAAAVFMMAAYIQGWTDILLQRTGLPVSAESLTALAIIGIGLMVLWKQLKPKRAEIKRKIGENASDEKDLFEGGGVYSFTDESGYAAWSENEQKTVVLSAKDGQVRLLSLDKKVTGDLLLEKFPCTIGSLPAENTYVISVRGISRRHAMVEKTETGIYMMDVGSTNGTIINGEKLKKNERRRLMVEDIIEFAGVRFMYC